MLDLLDGGIANLTPNSAFVACAGFEDRAPIAITRLADLQLTFSKSIIATYTNEENADAEEKFEYLSPKIVREEERRIKIPLEPISEFETTLTNSLSDVEHVFCDITGFNTSSMFNALNAIRRSKKSFSIMYTEASEYSPSKAEYEQYFSFNYIEEDLTSIEKYEASSSMYSKICDVDFVSGFEGSASPGYPYYLIAFLPFKRSRLGAVLQEIAAAKRLLIAAEPVRSDLAWRTKALKEINRDIIQDNSSEIIDLSTLSIKDTLFMLENKLNEDSNRYRYNFVIAPLGSKVQKVACWIFSVQNPRISVLSSTPCEMYFDSYSKGFRDTFISKDFQYYLSGEI